LEKLLKVKDVAEILQCNIQTVYENKKLPRLDVPGAGVRFRESDLENYISSCKKYDPFKITQHVDIETFRWINTPVYDILKTGGMREMPKGKLKESRTKFDIGAIYPRFTTKGHARWYLDYNDRYGNRKQPLVSNASSPEEAYIALKKAVEKEFDAQQGIKRKREKICFSDFSDIYLNDYAKIQKPKSWKSTDEGYMKVMKQHFGNIDLREITPMMVQQFRASRLKVGNEKSTTNRYLACLKKMLNLAIDEGYLESNPVSKIKFYSERENIRTRTLSPTEEEKLFDHSATHLIPIIQTALYTGMRLSEILRLQWNQIDFRNREIRVEKTKSERFRYIPMNSVLEEMFQRMKKSTFNNTYLFPNPNTGKPFTTIKTAFNATKRRASISDLRFHDLRHTAATRMIEAGVDVNTVKEILGHSSITVTERYTHSNREQKEKAVELLVAKPGKKGEKEEKLLHICDTDKDGSIISLPTVSESIN